MYEKRIVVFTALVALVTLIFPVMASAYDGRVLERNMAGSDVAEIQKMLESLGYDLTVDGRFGAQTESAIRTFQQDSGLLADGVVGPETLKALRALGQNQIHKVARGDSLSLLAKRYGTSVSVIMDANDLTDAVIYIGQKLVIPAIPLKAEEATPASARPAEEKSTGTPVMMTYQVQPGESTYVIARRFNTTVQAIAQASELNDPTRLKVGQKLLIPSNSNGADTENFIWPASGRISSAYGWRTHPIYKNRQFHGGIDIAVPTGTEVRAVASGKVIRSGDMDGFGLGVVIDHGKGVTTWYGHNSKLLIKAGETVVQGQVIARSGSTGVSTGPHLDFRIKVDGQTVNPQTWLPK